MIRLYVYTVLIKNTGKSFKISLDYITENVIAQKSVSGTFSE